MSTVKERQLPQFVRDILASPPRRGGGLNLWLYRVARVLHPYRDSVEIIELLQAATAGESLKRGEIERAVERSKATAWKPGQAPHNAARNELSITRSHGRPNNAEDHRPVAVIGERKMIQTHIILAFVKAGTPLAVCIALVIKAVKSTWNK